LNEFGASIGILLNGVQSCKLEGFEKVVTKNGFLEFREGFTNKFLGHNPHNKNNFADTQYDTEIWNINRRDYQDTLARAAKKSGAKILFDADVVRIDVDRCVAVLQDGRDLAADCIVGADGMKNVVRKSISATAHIEPVVLEEACFRCTVGNLDLFDGNVYRFRLSFCTSQCGLSTITTSTGISSSRSISCSKATMPNIGLYLNVHQKFLRCVESDS